MIYLIVMFVAFIWFVFEEYDGGERVDISVLPNHKKIDIWLVIIKSMFWPITIIIYCMKLWFVENK